METSGSRLLPPSSAQRQRVRACQRPRHGGAGQCRLRSLRRRLPRRQHKGVALDPLGQQRHLRAELEGRILLEDAEHFLVLALALQHQEVQPQRLGVGELAVSGGKIVAVGSGKSVGEGRETIDAEGLTLAPGIIDLHTHFDAQLTWDPYATPSNRLGVTTVVIGNCGFTIAPCKPRDRDRIY